MSLAIRDSIQNRRMIPWFIVALAALACSCSQDIRPVQFTSRSKNPDDSRHAATTSRSQSFRKPLLNPPLRHLNGASFKPGMRFWILTNLPPAGTVIDFESDHEFDSLSIQDAVFLQTPDGGQIWQPTEGLRNVWIEASLK